MHNIPLYETIHYVLGDDISFGFAKHVKFDIQRFIEFSKAYGNIFYEYTTSSTGLINEYSKAGTDTVFFLGSL